ncbi:MAG TPA: MmcQ/YjbR family DNA-binding protein [Cyclobacteriaceae bacterium]|nr:MmcQ/YjbR family DNA-binding protein [Cyclobacteriaceae bacterium]
MLSLDTLRKIALSFPETSEEPHFEKTSFRVRKKIFASYDDKNKTASIKLSPADQDVFSSVDRTIIYPVPNQWGRQGWTCVAMEKVGKELLAAALTMAYCAVAPKKLADQVRPDRGKAIKEIPPLPDAKPYGL